MFDRQFRHFDSALDSNMLNSKLQLYCEREKNTVIEKNEKPFSNSVDPKKPWPPEPQKQCLCSLTYGLPPRKFKQFPKEKNFKGFRHNTGPKSSSLIQNDTTYRFDYTKPKLGEVQRHKFRLSEKSAATIACATVTSISYRDLGPQPPISIANGNCTHKIFTGNDPTGATEYREKYTGKSGDQKGRENKYEQLVKRKTAPINQSMSLETVHGLSYIHCPLDTPKDNLTDADRSRESANSPLRNVDDTERKTVYTKSYQPNFGNYVPQPFRPTCGKPSTYKVNPYTVYGMDYSQTLEEPDPSINRMDACHGLCACKNVGECLDDKFKQWDPVEVVYKDQHQYALCCLDGQIPGGNN